MQGRIRESLISEAVKYLHDQVSRTIHRMQGLHPVAPCELSGISTFAWNSDSADIGCYAEAGVKYTVGCNVYSNAGMFEWVDSGEKGPRLLEFTRNNTSKSYPSLKDPSFT
jgi:hypothetical protein